MAPLVPERGGLARAGYQQSVTRGEKILFVLYCALKALGLCIFLAGIAQSGGWASSSTSDATTAYTAVFGLYRSRFTGEVSTAGSTASYRASVSSITWARQAGCARTLRVVQAVGVVAVTCKVSALCLFLYALLVTPSATVALRRFQWGRHLSLLYMTLAYFLNYMWTRVPSAAFFHYCHVTPGSSEACPRHMFEPPQGTSSIQEQSSAWRLVLAAGLISTVCVVLSICNRRTLAKLAKAEASLMRHDSLVAAGAFTAFTPTSARSSSLSTPLHTPKAHATQQQEQYQRMPHT